MNTRNKLLNALNGLELSFKKKEEFVDTLLNNSGGGNTIEYRDVSGLSKSSRTNFANEIAFMMKLKIGTLTTHVTAKSGYDMIGGGDSIKAISTDLNAKSTTLSDSYSVVQTFKDLLIERGWWEEYNSCPIITEEEFYSINE